LTDAWILKARVWTSSSRWSTKIRRSEAGDDGLAQHLVGVRLGPLGLRACKVWPGVRRAGLPKAEPGAGAGPAAPQAPPCFPMYGLIRQPHPRAGRDRLRSSEARRTSPAVFACTSTGHLYPSSCPGVADGLGARWRRPIIAKRRRMGEPLHLPRSRPRGPGQASSAAGCRALYAPERGAHSGCRACYSSFSGI
jgi:hypothetical protein